MEKKDRIIQDLSMKQNVGFIFEVFAFVITGMLISKLHFWLACLSYFISMGLAIWTGRQIELLAVEKYKRGKRR